ncbi:DUF5658 family protein [Engelhardtia mirabilis]|uniref:DUF5658 domain-containing protein n=1 Tax=Engelhardtia mirabilis TaxID=2528011 RepID=A0A518BK78_9BACT|nr:hypothetical protein Pla133_24570 [Planctomycetes bacterium Pla133]QDV01701.1 hypothetical protein Pla86_24560 [Planctomycetes bacterium Pla86]
MSEADLADTAFRERSQERRSRPTPRFSRFSLLGGRRRGNRRGNEEQGVFVDLYGTKLWLLIFWIAAMNIADSYFTLVHLQAGGVEVNPLADRMLLTGRSGFVLLKSGLIATALVVLCLHKNFWIARFGLWGAAGVYTLLVAYHLSLFGVE